MFQMFSLSTGYGSSAPCVRESCYSTPGWGGDGGLGSSGLIPEPLNTLWVHTWWNTQLSTKLGKQWWAGAQHRIWPMELLWHMPPSQLQLLWLCICTVYHFGSKSTITQTLSKHSCTAVDPADPSLKAKHPGGDPGYPRDIFSLHIFLLPLEWLNYQPSKWHRVMDNSRLCLEIWSKCQ